MADIRIKDLPLATGGTAPTGTDAVAIDGLTTRKTTITSLGEVAVPIASQAEAEAGVNAVKRMTPLTAKQSIASEVGVTLASKAQGDLANTALQSDDIGVTIQAFSANLDTLAAVVPGASGLSILSLGAVTDVRNYLDATPYVATRTALKAIDTTKETCAILTESGREGIFVWTTGDYSTQITADTLEGVFVKANAIAASSGAWVRIVVNGALNPKWFGAVGNGVANDNSPLQSCINLALAFGSSVRAIGKYRSDSAIIVTMPKGAGWATTSTTTNTIGTGSKSFTVASGLPISPGQTVTANAGTLGQGYMSGTVTSYSGTSLVMNATTVSGSGTYSGWDIVQNFRNTAAIAQFTISGEGQDTTEFYFPNSDGFAFKFSSQQHSVNVRNCSITTGANNTRTAVAFDNSYPYFGTFVAQSAFENVTFRGETGYSRGNSVWANCVVVSKVSDINFNNVNFLGSGVPSGRGLVLESTGAGSFDAPTTTATVFNLVNCNFTFLAVAVHYGSNSQTLQIANSFFAQNTTDVYVPPLAGSLQGLTVSGCTFFKGAPGDAIYCTTAVPNLIIVNNLIGVHGGFRGIALDKTNNTTIIGNQFIPDSGPNTAVAGIAIAECDAGSLTLIDGNTFSSVTVALTVGDAAKGVHFTPNNHCTTNITRFSSSGLAVGNSLDSIFPPSSRVSATQITSKTTAVTANGMTGDITTNNAALASGAVAAFVVNNTQMKVADMLSVNVLNGNYSVRSYGNSDGSFTVALKNESGVSLSDAVVVRFAVWKRPQTP